MENARGSPNMYYGWWIVVLLFYTLIHTAGNGFYAFSVYVPRLMEALNCEAAPVVNASILWAIVFGLSSPRIGAWVHRYGARKVFIAGTMCSGLVMLGTSIITEVWHLYVINVASGVVAAATILVPAQTVITLWFDRYRGRAMGLMMMGIGVGGWLVPWLVTTLIRLFSDWISYAESHSATPALLQLFTGWGGGLSTWRGAFRATALLSYTVVVPPLVLWLRNRPSQVGQFVDGVDPRDEVDPNAGLPSGVPVGRALRSVTFWLVFGVYLLQICALTGIGRNTQLFAERQVGYSMDMAWRFMGYAMVVTIPMRFVFGRLCDRFNPKYLTACASIGLLGGTLTLWLGILKLGWVGYFSMLVFAIFKGIGIAGNAVVMPILVGTCFGERDFGKILGFVMMGFGLGVIFGAPVMARIFDETGSFEPAFAYSAVLLIVSAILALVIRVEALHPEFTMVEERE